MINKGDLIFHSRRYSAILSEQSQNSLLKPINGFYSSLFNLS